MTCKAVQTQKATICCGKPMILFGNQMCQSKVHSGVWVSIVLRCVKPSFWIEYFHRQTEPVRSSLDKIPSPHSLPFSRPWYKSQKGLWIPREKEEKAVRNTGKLEEFCCHSTALPNKNLQRMYVYWWENKIVLQWYTTLLSFRRFFDAFWKRRLPSRWDAGHVPTKKRSFSHTKIRSFSNTKKRSFFNKNSVKSSTEFSPPPRFCAT